MPSSPISLTTVHRATVVPRDAAPATPCSEALNEECLGPVSDPRRVDGVLAGTAISPTG
ncbi:hypothetical protein IMZ11_17725 [Microtetraspora sp. AC03309]|uniref:hypothetical protein n=1 Tax=Microtetraspora sp. AC03309 TaxID=2779376 RepID=UPI001E3D5F09|nr:hypothetical protein [Microtetraspora sp. AC03309]MCC5577466.1 hypothetical protein [Microtetraspora sp. AC03309]